jgi:hypothetical protein
MTHVTGVRIGTDALQAFVVLDDSTLAVTLDTLAASGPVTVVHPVESVTSSVLFTKLADDPRPRLLSVRDVAGDQGGRVMLKWRASDFDQSRYSRIRGYRVWRRAPNDAVEQHSSGLQLGQEWRSWDVGGVSAFWESVAELPAAFLNGYAYAASTLRDSTDLGNPYTAFFVQALTSDPYVFYNSSPDSGYSVDNLAPPAPGPMNVRYGPTTNTVRWTPARVADLRAYHLYRGTSSTFIPMQSNLLVATTDSVFTDVAGPYYYKLAAVDIHGNRSRVLSAAPDRPVGALASVAKVERAPSRIRVTWHAGGNPGLLANVYRSTEGGLWAAHGSIVADGVGYALFEDNGVEDAERYGYRLGVIDVEGTEQFLAEVWVDPMPASLLTGLTVVNPSLNGAVAVSLANPGSQAGVLSLYDVTGRLVDHVPVSPATEVRSFLLGGSGRLKAGVYMLRFESGQKSEQRRVVVLH